MNLRAIWIAAAVGIGMVALLRAWRINDVVRDTGWPRWCAAIEVDVEPFALPRSLRRAIDGARG